MEAEIIAEETRLQLEDETWASDANNIDALIESALQDFPDEKPTSEKYQGIQSAADEIAQHCITDKTRAGHLRIIRAFVVYMLMLDWKWSPDVTAQSPLDVRAFIMKKCGAVEKGYEGKKLSNGQESSQRLFLFGRLLHTSTRPCILMKVFGLPTHSLTILQFMVGLEKSKAAAGETSQSARALTLEDIHKLYDQCLKSKDITTPECRWGVVQYTIYLLAWLILLCIEEATNLEFERIDFHPGECCYFEVRLRTQKSAQTGVSLTWQMILTLGYALCVPSFN
ncbi:hypothetical protein K439DRAFT_1660130 [Ramaria rubella]|nr:hypothetical protein K439DRAFT_1660130 [Ramaria rubella]